MTDSTLVNELVSLVSPNAGSGSDSVVGGVITGGTELFWGLMGACCERVSGGKFSKLKKSLRSTDVAERRGLG